MGLLKISPFQTTTDLNNECTIKHTGTSASAPLAAGIIALALEANPNLTWRDVQHLIVKTSEYEPLADNFGWITNGAGFRFDIRFGFGLMNAHSLVLSALNWTTVPEKSICTVPANENVNVSMTHGEIYNTVFRSSGCNGTSNEVNYLEHVEVKVNIAYTTRGSLQAYLTSPKGTKIPLLSPRINDDSSKGFYNWRFMSVATWGEPSVGTWSIEIFDLIGPETNTGRVGPLTLILHGTKEKPQYMNEARRKYSDEETLPENSSEKPSGWSANEISGQVGDEETLQTSQGWSNELNDNDLPEDFWFQDEVDENRVLDRVHHQNFHGHETNYNNDDFMRKVFCGLNANCQQTNFDDRT